MNGRTKVYEQASAYASPWTIQRRILTLIWHTTWSICCSWTPKPFNRWRLQVLTIFGAKIVGTPFVHQRARIELPWNIEMHHRACLGDRTAVYCLDRVTIEEGATVAQEAYLCTGSHDFNQAHIPLETAPIVVGRGAFVGARAFILPGITLGAGCIVGAMAVVTRDVGPHTMVAGNPARSLGKSALLSSHSGETPIPISGDNKPQGY